MAIRSACVIGLGPVGSIFAGHLHAAGIPFVAVDSSPGRVAAIRRLGIVVGGGRLLWAKPTAVYRTVEEAVHDGPFDVVLVCTKATALDHLAPSLVPLVKERALTVGFQNGIGTEEILKAALGAGRVARGVINFAGVMETPASSVRVSFFQEANLLGGALSPPMEEQAQELARVLCNSGLKTAWASNIREQVWRKTIRLAILAPLCALTQLDMASALANPHLEEVVRALLEECVQVAQSAGLPFGESFTQGCLHYIANAGPHRPSMLMDVLGGRQTEVQFVNQKIASEGESLGVPVPFNRTISNLLKAIDSLHVRPGASTSGRVTERCRKAAGERSALSFSAEMIIGHLNELCVPVPKD